MKLYLLTSIEKEFKEEFCHQTRLQNFKIIQIIATISFVAGVIWRLFSFSSHYQVTLVNYDSFKTINLYFLTLSLLFALLLVIMRKRLMPEKLVRYHFIVWLYSLLFILKNILFSFFAQRVPNPSNTLTLIMVGFFVIASILVFTLLETMAIVSISLVVFIVGLYYFEINPTMWTTNLTAFSVMLIVYVIISRLLYTYHCNYFKKVKIIEAKNKQIELANDSKSELLSMVAHDLRSPLNNIQSLVELMQMPGQPQEEQAAYYSYIKDCCDKADRIIREIVSAAQESNENNIVKNPEHINTLVQDCFRNWKKIVNNKIKMDLVLPEEWIVLPINKDKIQRIIDNLIGNAIKFTPEQTGEIVIELKKKKNLIRISVSDNGIGIPQKHLPFLFDKFTIAGRKGIHDEDSFGLGLHISKQFAEQHGGKLWVETTEHKGSTFYLDLPA